MIGTTNLEKMMGIVDLYRFSKERRLYVYGVLDARLLDQGGFEETRRIIAEAARHDKESLELARRFSIEEPTHHRRHAEQAASIDRALNRAISGLATRLRCEGEAFPDDHPIARRAHHLLQQLFPEGAAAITRLPYVEKATRVQHLLEKLKTTFRQDLQTFALHNFLERLQNLHDTYHPALGPKQRPQLTRALLAERDRQGDAKLRYLVVHILHEFGRPDLHDDKLCEQLLGPILAQNEDLGKHLRQRRAGKKVQAKLKQPKTEDAPEQKPQAINLPQTNQPAFLPEPSPQPPRPRPAPPQRNPWTTPRSPLLNRQPPPRPQAPRQLPLQNRTRTNTFGTPQPQPSRRLPPRPTTQRPIPRNNGKHWNGPHPEYP